MKIYMIFDHETGKERAIYGKQTRFYVCKRQAEATANKYKHWEGRYYVREFDLVESF